MHSASANTICSIFETRVLAQNRTAVSEIHRSLASSKWWKSQEKLIIVCVDNEEYAKHARGYAAWSPESPDESPRLSVMATGIPELRRIITEFPANARWESLNHHIKDTWRCTLEGFHLSGSVTKAQRKAQVDAEIKDTLKVCLDSNFLLVVFSHRTGFGDNHLRHFWRPR